MPFSAASSAWTAKWWPTGCCRACRNWSPNNNQRTTNVTIAQTPHHTLAEVLEHEALHLAQLIDLLQEERGDLISGTEERINQLAAEKLHRIQALDTYAARRNALLTGLGYTQSSEGMEQAVEASGELAPRLRALWSKIADRALVARDLNDLNGNLIRARLWGGRGRLSRRQRAVRGAADGLYSADGLSQAVRDSRPLGNV